MELSEPLGAHESRSHEIRRRLAAVTQAGDSNLAIEAVAQTSMLSYAGLGLVLREDPIGVLEERQLRDPDIVEDVRLAGLGPLLG